MTKKTVDDTRSTIADFGDLIGKDGASELDNMLESIPVDGDIADSIIEAEVYGDNYGETQEEETSGEQTFVMDVDIDNTDEKPQELVLTMDFPEEEPEEELASSDILEIMMSPDEENEESPSMSREELVSNIISYYKLVNIPFLPSTLDMMTDAQLEEHLKLLDANNGGSWNMATALTAAKENYEKFISSEVLNAKLKLVDEKSHDFVRMAQQISRKLGSDTVISGVRVDEYHTLLRKIVKDYSAVMDKVFSVGQTLGINYPDPEPSNEDNFIPIMENMPHNPEFAFYTLNVLLAHLDKFFYMSSATTKTNENLKRRCEQLELENKKLRDESSTHYEVSKNLRASIDRINQASYYVIRDRVNAGYIRKRNPDAPVRKIKDLDLRGKLHEDAMEFTSLEKAKSLVSRLMAHKAYRKRDLYVKRVTVTVA
jgi:hypothetical protein